MVNIVWENEAVKDFKEIIDFIALDSKHYAALEAEKITTAVSRLAKDAFLGKFLRYSKKSELRELVESNYRIIYEIASEKTIYILFIHHGARDLRHRLKKL